MTEMNERRGAQRISTNLAVKWSTPASSHDSRIIDLSPNGCFILTANEMPVDKISRVKQVAGNEAIQVELDLSADEWLKLNGEVVYKVDRTGFAVRFLNLKTDDEQVLRAFIEKQKGDHPKSLPFPRVGRGRRR